MPSDTLPLATDEFTDGSGQHYIAGQPVVEPVWRRFELYAAIANAARGLRDFRHLPGRGVRSNYIESLIEQLKEVDDAITAYEERA